MNEELIANVLFRLQADRDEHRVVDERFMKRIADALKAANARIADLEDELREARNPKRAPSEGNKLVKP